MKKVVSGSVKAGERAERGVVRRLALSYAPRGVGEAGVQSPDHHGGHVRPVASFVRDGITDKRIADGQSQLLDIPREHLA